MDYLLFQQVNGLAGHWEWLDVLGIFFAKYFEYILVALIILIFRKTWKVIFQAFLAAGLARLVIVNIIRWIVQRPRPFVENGFDGLTTSHINLLLPQTTETSFPSGHAAFYFALSFIVYKYNKKTGILFFIASFLISVSRVFTGLHWPSDIIAGALVGIFSGWLTLKAFNRKKLTGGQ